MSPLLKISKKIDTILETFGQKSTQTAWNDSFHLHENIWKFKTGEPQIRYQ